CGDHSRGGTFAFAAGDVDDAQTILGVAQQIEQGAHAVEFQVAGRGRPLLVIDAPEPEANRFVVGHPILWQWAVKKTLDHRIPSNITVFTAHCPLLAAPPPSAAARTPVDTGAPWKGRSWRPRTGPAKCLPAPPRD